MKIGLCHFCGLPLFGVRRFADKSTPEENSQDVYYCCYGCRMAESITQGFSSTPTGGKDLTRIGISIFLTINIVMISMALWADDVPGIEGHSLAPALWTFLRYLCMFLALPVLAFLGLPLFENAWLNLRSRRMGMDVLLAVGVGLSFGYSIYSTLLESGHVYFEVGCVVLLTAIFGRWLEAVGRMHASQSLDSLRKLIPQTVYVRREDREIEVPLENLSLQDIVLVRTGDVVPCDGKISAGTSAVDQHIVTGESEPRNLEPGNSVFAGALVLDGRLEIEPTSTAENGAVTRILDLISSSQSANFTERAVDRISTFFAPFVLVIAILGGVVRAREEGVESGLKTLLATVLIACPCALGLAVPLAFWAARGTALGRGILVRSADGFERLSKATTFLFDKTGTLTLGAPTLLHFQVAPMTPSHRADFAMNIAMTLAKASTHPNAKAIANHFANRREEFSHVFVPPQLDCIQEKAGRGIQAIDSRSAQLIGLGSLRFLIELGMEAEEDWIQNELANPRDKGCSRCFFGIGTQVVAIFSFVEQLLPEVKSTVQVLTAGGLNVQVLSGDTKDRADQLQRELHIPVRGEHFPETKVNEINRLRSSGQVVAMVGDGINDAPAVSAADVGIAMGRGADITRLSADICLLGDDLSRLPWLLELSKKTNRIVKQNIFWAFAYNGAAVVFALFGFIHPLVAGIAMVASSAFVVGNAMRLCTAKTLPALTPTVVEENRTFSESRELCSIS